MHHITADTIRELLRQGELPSALSDYQALAQSLPKYDAGQALELAQRYEALLKARSEGGIDDAEKIAQESRLSDALRKALDRVPSARPPAQPPATDAFVNIRHKFRAEPIAENGFLVTITVTLHNKGRAAMSRLSGNVRVSRLYPLADPWQQKIREQLAEGKQTYFDLSPYLATLWQSSFDDKKIGLAPGEREQLVFRRIVAGYIRGIEIQTTVYDPEGDDRLMAWKHSSFHYFKH